MLRWVNLGRRLPLQVGHFCMPINRLKSDGMGFRVIAGYLQSKRKLKVSATYLSKLWKEVEAG